MRFFTTGKYGQTEVIGELVDLGRPDHFAVHAQNPFSIVRRGVANFAVSHVESGFIVAGGQCIDEAIENAKQRIAMLTDEMYREGIAAAIKIKAERFSA